MAIGIAESFASVFFFITRGASIVFGKRAGAINFSQRCEAFRMTFLLVRQCHITLLQLYLSPSFPTEFGPNCRCSTDDTVHRPFDAHSQCAKDSSPQLLPPPVTHSGAAWSKSTADHSGPSFCSILLCLGFLCLCAFPRQR